MKTTRLALSTLLLAVLATSRADDRRNAAETVRPSPSDVRALDALPPRIALRGLGDGRQMIVTATLASGRTYDATAAAEYSAGDDDVVRVDPGGRVVALADGQTTLIVTFAGRTLAVPVEVAGTRTPRALNFTNQIVPVFTKLGCNAGGCHGKASGQNGFKLSLLGFEPAQDYEAIVREARGRRLFPAAPASSLLLLKPTGAVAHGGGRRLDPDSDDYRLLLRWIEAGAPEGRSDDPTVTGISVYPPARSLGRRDRQQLAVIAHYSDGSAEDVSRRAQYDTNEPAVAAADGVGLVRTQDQTGEAAVMARYQGHVAVFRVAVPRDGPAPAFDFPEQTLVDRYSQAKWRELGIAPSDVCTDAQFIRRASIDITGTLPTPAEVRAFAAEGRPDKRARLVDVLLERPEYADYFATRWADVLHVKRRQQPGLAEGTFAFHAWIRDAVAADMPYDRFVREILTATGDEVTDPPTVWFKELQTPDQLVNDTAQLFLGQRMACAQCHHHPYEKWSQDDYWGLAAYFGRLGRKALPVPGGFQNRRHDFVRIFNRDAGQVVNKRTGRPAAMKLPGEPPADLPAGLDPREQLADWMADPKNPYFARAVVNRYWAHFFGRGIVDPADDMRVTNPPSNPALLDALAGDFVAHGDSLKHLVQTICASRTYQLSATPNSTNRGDRQTFARHTPRRLEAEVLYDAVCQVTGTPAAFAGLPRDRHAPRRAISLPDESFTSYFLDVFGRPQRISACECERGTDANLAQSLHLLNSDEVQARLSQPGGRADRLARDPRPDSEKVGELFLWAVAHEPTPAQLHAALGHLRAHPGDPKTAYENIIWALLNSKEFAFNE